MKYWPYLVLAVTLPTLLILYIISLGYTPLTIAVLTLPNETEILLFTVFAGVGAGTIGHFFGYRRAEKKNNSNASKPEPKQGKKPVNLKYLVLILAVVALFVVPFIINPNGDFGGTDGQGPEVIEDEGYTPWIGPVAYQPDDLGERLLFSLQVGLGGAVLGYFVGFETGKAVNKEEE
jgi:cobalt/nickel transport protein